MRASESLPVMPMPISSMRCHAVRTMGQTQPLTAVSISVPMTSQWVFTWVESVESHNFMIIDNPLWLRFVCVKKVVHMTLLASRL